MDLDDPAISGIVFHPRAEDPWSTTRGIPTRVESGDAVIGGYLHPAAGADSLILFFHGNGEIAADYESLAPFYAGLGASFWVVDYRGYGRSTGTPSYSRMFTDAEAVARAIPGIEEIAGTKFRHVFVMGRSLGSASAISLAAGHHGAFDGLILDSAFADALAVIATLGGPVLRRRDMKGFEDNIDRMRDCTLPVLIIHGTDDSLIPVSDSEDLFKACGSPDKKLVKIPGAGHNDLLMAGFETYFSEMRAFMFSRL